MALLSTFIGVNKHEDPRISDLAGAARDATALWALFSDSISDIQASLLLDENANFDSINQAFDKTLGLATKDDTVIIFYAGHGTPDHQIVPYNTNIDDLSSTTIPMDALSGRLANSLASSIIVILDCCFSGGATARVLSDIPKSRGTMFTVEALQGKGRVIIAASKDDQAAYELKGHGLLTKALIQVFLDNKEGVEIGQITDSILASVRAETSRFGWEQTPVIFNLIEGGLKFPPILPGRNYYSAFPELTHLQVSNDPIDLIKYGLPKEIANEWKVQFPDGLNPLQLEAVNGYRVLDGNSLLVVAPTSSGKTFIGEMASAKAIADGRKAVFLLPYRALTNEKFDDFQALYGERLGIRIIRCTGDYTDDTNNFIRGRYEIALLTYEMFLRLSVVVPSLLTKIGLIVLDEAQFINDKTRGINVELLLTNLITNREQGIDPQILALSAVIGDVNNFHDWLGCKTLCTYDRPVPLIEGVIDRTGELLYVDTDGQDKTKQLLPRTKIIQRGQKPSNQDIMVPLIRQLVSEDEQVLVFRNTRGTTVGCASYLANELNLPAADNVLNELTDQDPSRTTADLQRVLAGGVAFHNSDLTREERRSVERAFRDTKGSIRAMVATTTVAAGVNTPSSVVIISETFFHGSQKQDFSIAQYKNMAGRAGRLGFKKQGISILLASSHTERNRLFNRFVKGSPEPINSSFNPSELETWILRLLTQVGEIPRTNIVKLLASTYGGYLEGRNNPDWKTQIQNKLESLIEKMFQLDLLEAENDCIRLSLLGKMCGRSSLSFKSLMSLIALFKRTQISFTAEQLMASLQILPEVGGYTPIFKKGQKESAWQSDVSDCYGNPITQALQFGASDQYEYYARCKRAAILWCWINGQSIDSIEKRFSTTPYGGNIGAGDIRGFADRTRMYLGSAFDIIKLLLSDKSPDEESIDILLKQLETGLPSEALGLLDIPITLTRGEYLALYEAGHKRAEDIIAQSKQELKKYIRLTRLEQLLAVTKDIKSS